MKLSKLAVAAAIAWGIYVGNASAQNYGQQPVRQVSANDYFYQPEASPSDRPPPAPMVEQAPMGNGVATAPTGACAACAEEEEATCDPWRLFCQKECAWNFTGYIAAGGTWNPASPADRFNGPVTWLDRSNDIQMTEIWMNFEKPTEYGTCDWQMGGKFTGLYGSNYRWDTSAGLESNFGMNGQFYGLALPNAYLEFTKGDVKTKVGHFVSPVGFYTVGTGNNFFNLIPYTYQYGEPFTHTGIYSTWQANDDLELGAALINGWDSTANWNPAGTALAAAVPGVTDPWNRHLGFLASAVKKNVFCCDGSDSFAYVGVISQEPDVTTTLRTNRYLQTLVYQRQISDNTQYIIQSDFGTQQDALGPGASAQWFGINQYLYWKQNDCWKWGVNVEWFRDDDGFRVGQAVPSFGSPNARGLARGPFDGDFYRIMLGPNWTPTANWTIRPTLVYDWYTGDGAAGGVLPYNDGTRSDQFLVNLDAYFVF